MMSDQMNPLQPRGLIKGRQDRAVELQAEMEVR